MDASPPSPFLPTTTVGKWSVGLSAFFLIAVGISCVLVLVFEVLSFNDHWWDVTVGVAFPASIIGLLAGVVAAVRYKDRSAAVYLSIAVGVCAVLFLLLHSLFIND